MEIGLEQRLTKIEQIAYVSAFIAHHGNRAKIKRALRVSDKTLDEHLEQADIDTARLSSFPYTRFPIHQVTQELAIDERALLEELLTYAYGRYNQVGYIIGMAPEIVAKRAEQYRIDIDAIKKEALRLQSALHNGDIEKIGEALHIRCNADVVNDMVKYDLDDSLELIRQRVESDMRKNYFSLGKTSRALGLSQKYLNGILERFGVDEKRVAQLKRDFLSDTVIKHKGDIDNVASETKADLTTILSDLSTLGLEAELLLIRKYVQRIIKRKRGSLQKTAEALSIPYTTFWRNRQRLGIDIPQEERLVIDDNSYSKLRTGNRAEKVAYGKALFSTSNPNFISNVYGFMERFMQENHYTSPAELTSQDRDIPQRIYDCVGIRRGYFPHLVEALFGVVLRIGSLTITRQNINYLVSQDLSKKPVNALRFIHEDLDHLSDSAFTSYPTSSKYPENLITLDAFSRWLNQELRINVRRFIHQHQNRIYSPH